MYLTDLHKVGNSSMSQLNNKKSDVVPKNSFLYLPEKPKLKCLGFTYNGAKLFNMLPIQMKKTDNPNTFKTMTKDWIWENIPSY